MWPRRNVDRVRPHVSVITLNNLGDPTTPILQIQQNKSGTWTFLKQFGVSGS